MLWYSLGAVFVMAADLDDIANTSSDNEDPTFQHETLESVKDMEVGGDATQEYHALHHHREQHTAENQQGKCISL